MFGELKIPFFFVACSREKKQQNQTKKQSEEYSYETEGTRFDCLMLLY